MWGAGEKKAEKCDDNATVATRSVPYRQVPDERQANAPPQDGHTRCRISSVWVKGYTASEAASE